MKGKTAFQLQQQLARRELARRRLLQFTKETHGSYHPGWVHDDVCRRLERFSQAIANRESPRLMLLMPPRHGKQLADSTPVLTPQGWKQHGDLVPGDEVFHPSGKAVKVLAVSDKTPSDWVVRFGNGEEIRCHENHEWQVYDRGVRRFRVLSTKDLAQREVLPSKRCVFQMTEVQPLEMPHAEDLPVDPYMLGVWLGDGSRTKPCVTHAATDWQMIVKCQEHGYTVTAICVNRITNVLTSYFSGPRPNNAGRLTKELKRAGLRLSDKVGHKFVPEKYLRSSIDQRLELLAGLMDTDGHCDPRGRCRITTVDRELAKGVYDLCTSLGFRPYVQEVPPVTSTSGVEGKRWCYVIGFQPTMDIPCALPRKRPPRFARQRRLGITSVTYEPNGEQGHCIQVDAPDGLYLAGRKLIPTHNSEIASIRFPAWHLGKYPDHEIINVGYNTELPMKFSRKVRETMRDPLYQALFPDTKLDPHSQSVEAWYTTRNGGYTAAGVGGGITGKGAHVLIVDDPLKNQEEADSITTRDKLWDWYQSTAYTRLAPGGGVLVIETWWNDDDLAGRLQEAMRHDPEADQFEVVRYPALSTQWEYRERDTLHITCTDEPLSQEELDGNNLELLRPIDTCLHEDRYPTKSLKRIRANLQPRIWSALYQQNPVPDEGMYFKKEYFKEAVTFPSSYGLRVVTAWDFAITEKQTSDYTVGVTIMQDYNDVLYVLDVHRFRGDSFDIVEAMMDVADKWGKMPNVDYMIGAEDGQIWRSIEPLLKRRMAERREFPSVEVLRPITDKMARARPLQGRMQQHRVIFPQDARWKGAVMSEMLRFPAGAHDDVVDALAWAVRLTMEHEPPQRPAEKRLASWKDKLNSIGGGNGSHMTA